jgi:hypothetical protein
MHAVARLAITLVQRENANGMSLAEHSESQTDPASCAVLAKGRLIVQRLADSGCSLTHYAHDVFPTARNPTSPFCIGPIR